METGTSAANELHNALAVTSAGIALGSLVVGAVIFLILPRFNGGYMSGLNMQPTMITGFSDDVELGEIGEIKKSSMVVMRVTVVGSCGSLNQRLPSNLVRATPHGGTWSALARRGSDQVRWQALVQRPT